MIWKERERRETKRCRKREKKQMENCTDEKEREK